jgi:cysteine desulfurase
VIYLDHHATTPLDPRVREAMEPYFNTAFGNPHSRDHAVGWRASEAVEKARGEIAAAVGANASEIIFTSGATEANNLALIGVGGKTLTTAIEHPSVLNTGAVSVVQVTGDGLIDPEAIAAAIRPEAKLVSVGLVNHEIGVIQPIAEIARVCHAKGVLVHADCAQALGKHAVDLVALGVDLASFSAHKAYGPMGIGALFVRRGVHLTPLIKGGGQEMGLRAGTVPLPLAVGFGVAAGLAAAGVESDGARIARLRDLLLDRLNTGIPDLKVNGTMSARIPGNLNLTLPDVDAETLLLEMPEIAISTGSACASGTSEPSAVLAGLGLRPEEAARSLRICLGRFTSEDEVAEAAGVMISAWSRLARGQSPA